MRARIVHQVVVCSSLLALGAVLAACDSGAASGTDGGDVVTADAGVAPSGPLVAGATLAGVSADQRFLAFYAGSATLANGLATGPLSVLGLGTGAGAGAQARLADGAFAAGFSQGGATLTFLTGQAASADAGGTAIYGALSVWTPALSAPVKLTAGLATRVAIPPDGSFVMYVDAATPARSAPGKVAIARATDCKASTCGAVILSDPMKDVEITAAVASPDGKYAAFQVRSNGQIPLLMTKKYETFLVTIADLKVQKIAETEAAAVEAAPIAFSPDGKLVATAISVMGGGGIGMFVPTPLQLQVIKTESASTDGAWKGPKDHYVLEAAWSDAQTLLLRCVTTRLGDGGVHKVTAAGTSQVTPSAGAIAVPASSGRYLFVATSGDARSNNVLLFDMQSPMPVGALLAGASPGFPLVSDDGTQARLLDAYDAAARAGQLIAVSLPGAERAGVADKVSALHAGFAEGTSKMVYIDGADATGAGALSVWSKDAPTRLVARGTANFRTRKAPDTLYFAVTGTDDSVTPARTPGIYAVALP